MALKRSVKRLEQICKLCSTFASAFAPRMPVYECLRCLRKRFSQHYHFDNTCRHIHIKKTTRARKQ